MFYLNAFLKAAILTVVVLMLTLVLVFQVDGMRQNDLQASINNLSFELENNRLISRFADVMAPDENKCEFLEYTSAMQEKRAFSLAYTIQEYEKANIVGVEYENLKKTYFLSLADLYITSFENKKACPEIKNVPVAFFYSQSDCPACNVQGSVLSSVSSKCDGVSIFAFPSDTNYPFLNVFSDRYKITSVPSIVINDTKTLHGLASEDELISALKNAGANCSK